VRQHRGDHNRLGIAVQMCFLRYPGRALGEDERPPDRLLNFIAEQLGTSIVAWDLYAKRDETRREHLLELFSRLGLEQFGTKHYREISAWLGSTALQTTQGIVLVQTALDEQTAVYQLKEYEPDRRHAALVAVMIETAATLTDEVLDLHDRLIGRFFTKSKGKYESAKSPQPRSGEDRPTSAQPLGFSGRTMEAD
jgi:hypothetical protein